ncbi:unnamed protein product [Blepharisma stoltei]|uniref:protein-serine/threonine phosphatase n=1 Tax=Blepharisma stoltei TaxID=1481888 RepID=A0AAU9INE7_9CILI|nr:unnamed protein product [Blepharisma stoltei]
MNTKKSLARGLPTNKPYRSTSTELTTFPDIDKNRFSTPFLTRNLTHKKLSLCSNKLNTQTVAKFSHLAQQVLNSTPQTPKEYYQILKPSSISRFSCGKVLAYAGNTNKGLIRKKNEDRIMIISSVNKPHNKVFEDNWPNCSYFGLFDGHGGNGCSNFLRDNLHQFIIESHHFPLAPHKAINEALARAESEFMKISKETNDKSGSCAVIALIVGQFCFIANVGDSRALMSGMSGKHVYSLTTDHKPAEPQEQARIFQAGGLVYSTTALNKSKIYRVLPGRLSVSRTIGDIEAKNFEMGGNPGVVISTPEIRKFEIKPEYDFIMLGSDGIFDTLTNRDVVDKAWESIDGLNDENVPSKCARAAEGIILESFKRQTRDNVSTVIIALRNLNKS